MRPSRALRCSVWERPLALAAAGIKKRSQSTDANSSRVESEAIVVAVVAVAAVAAAFLSAVVVAAFCCFQGELQLPQGSVVPGW